MESALDNKNNNNTTINQKQKKRINLGVIIFLFILVYLVIRVYIPFSKEEISIYSVEEGSIYLKKTYKGLIVRDEKCVYSGLSGFVNYYVTAGDRVKKDENICSIGSNIALYDKLKAENNNTTLDSSDFKLLKNETKEIYLESTDFRDFALNSDRLSNYYQKLIDLKLLESLDEIVYNTGITADFNIIKSEFSGIVSYETDGLENVTESDFSNASFDDEYKVINAYETREKGTGEFLYKIIASENWKIIIRLDDDIYDSVSEKSKLSFCINGDKEITAPVYFAKCGENYFAIVSMEEYLINYLDERFLDITFNTEDTVGIKIPASALTYKEFYRIPDEYFIEQDGQTGLITENTSDSATEKTYYFLKTDVFLSENGFKYISTDQIDSGTYIVSNDYKTSSMIYLFGIRLCGAYNVNNGYSVFKRLEIIETGSDYVIAKKNSASGIAIYDHIALNADEINEGEIIY